MMNIITSENILLISSILLISGVLIGKMSYRFGLPLLLVFLLAGMGFGVDGLGIHFEDMHTAQFIGMIALCVILFSRKLHLTEQLSIDETDFGVELSETDQASLETILITPRHLAGGDTLKDMQLPKGQLVMMVQRNGQHIIPNGTLHLKPGDALLIIKENKQ